MATKKQAKKKVAKAAKPVKKAPAKKPAVSKSSKPVKKAAVKKPVVSKTSKPVKKTPPASKKTALSNKTASKKAVNHPKPMAKKSPAPVVKKSVPAKVSTPAKVETKKPVEPVKKPSVAAPSHQEVKPVIKPLAKPVEKKSSKPVVIPKTSTTKVVKYEPDFTKSVLDSSHQNNNQEQSGPTMRYSDAELTEFRDLILKKLDTAKKELAYLQGLITRKDESGDLDEGRYMTMEDGSMSMEREQLSQMASRQIQFIDHLEKAMMRIENKTYGICRVTGKLIDKARLRAVPHATLSIEAKQMMSK
jgi:RNA polymerase-binding transcription factor DksA